MQHQVNPFAAVEINSRLLGNDVVNITSDLIGLRIGHLDLTFHFQQGNIVITASVQIVQKVVQVNHKTVIKVAVFCT